jgi:hypothetical protein
MTETPRTDPDKRPDEPLADEDRREADDPSRAVDDAGTEHPAADSEDAYVDHGSAPCVAGAGGRDVGPEAS